MALSVPEISLSQNMENKRSKNIDKRGVVAKNMYRSQDRDEVSTADKTFTFDSASRDLPLH